MEVYGSKRIRAPIQVRTGTSPSMNDSAMTPSLWICVLNPTCLLVSFHVKFWSSSCIAGSCSSITAAICDTGNDLDWISLKSIDALPFPESD